MRISDWSSDVCSSDLIAASQAEAQAAAARLAMARNDAIAEARAAGAQIAAAQSRVAAAEASQRTAEETYRLARIAYEAGKSPLVELLNARQGLGAARGLVLDAKVARFEARAQLARLQGRTLPGDESQCTPTATRRKSEERHVGKARYSTDQ